MKLLGWVFRARGGAPRFPWLVLLIGCIGLNLSVSWLYPGLAAALVWIELGGAAVIFVLRRLGRRRYRG